MSRKRKPRYIITMEPTPADTLERYSAILGARPSSVIKQLIEQAMERMESGLVVMEQLTKAKSSALEQATLSIETGISEGFRQLNDEQQKLLDYISESNASASARSANIFSESNKAKKSFGNESQNAEGHTLSINKGNKGVRLNRKPTESRHSHIFKAVDNVGGVN